MQLFAKAVLIIVWPRVQDCTGDQLRLPCCACTSVQIPLASVSTVAEVITEQVRAPMCVGMTCLCSHLALSSRHVDALEAVVVAGVGDADPEARLNARTLFWSLYSHYPERIPG